MKKINNLPAISGSKTREAKSVDVSALKTSGIAFATYGIREGDTIEFPDTWDDVQVFEQPVRTGSTATQTLVVVMRNDKPSYLSMGTLRKSDVNNVYTCPFTQSMGEMDNDYDRLQALLGKTIKGVSSKSIKAQAFDRLTGLRLEGQTVDQTVPIIEYV